MKILYAATISTFLVLIFGLAIILPTFTRPSKPKSPRSVMLSFSVVEIGNPSEWCINLSRVLEKHGVRASIFFAGSVADQHPRCLQLFNNSIDIGSQTYDYVDLTAIDDYSQQLEEIVRGKQAIDQAGNITSRLFRAPFGSTDQNIYSLLNRANITADFSYPHQYNVFLEGKFIKFRALTCDSPGISPEDIVSLATADPIIYEFSNTLTVEYIEDCITKLVANSVQFVNASDLAGFNLTERA